jgi:hypothetical protein
MRRGSSKWLSDLSFRRDFLPAVQWDLYSDESGWPLIYAGAATAGGYLPTPPTDSR